MQNWGPKELNFESLAKNMPTDRTQRVDKKTGVTRVMIIKKSKITHFLCFLLMAAKNWSHFGENMILKDLI